MQFGRPAIKSPRQTPAGQVFSMRVLPSYSAIAFSKAVALSTLPVAANSCLAILIASTQSAADESLPLPEGEPALRADLGRLFMLCLV